MRFPLRLASPSLRDPACAAPLAFIAAMRVLRVIQEWLKGALPDHDVFDNRTPVSRRLRRRSAACAAD